MSKTLPPVAGVPTADFLKQAQQTLSSSLQSAPTPKAPWNFKATSARGGINLQWSPLVSPGQGSAAPAGNQVQAADGYELQRSATGNFNTSATYTSIAVRDPTQSAYFDSLGGPSQTFYYRLRATNGTGSNPYTVHGLFTGTLKQTSIDSNDTVTAPTTVYDTSTNDQSQKRAGAWPSGTQYPNDR